MQVIRHRNRRQNSPLIELVEHSTAYFPRVSIGKHWFARLDTKRNEINRALFPRQPVWNARRSAHDANSLYRRLTETAYNSIQNPPTPSQSVALSGVAQQIASLPYARFFSWIAMCPLSMM